jgi:1-acyl-sn-glycerol-3-phosphate acyltransferase
MVRPDGKSLALSLRNICETLAICFPTVVEAVRGRVTKDVCDERLGRWSRAVLDNARIHLDLLGRENLRPGQTYLVMSNHQSLYDIPVLFQSIGPNVRMVAKRELFQVPIFGGALAAAGFVAIDRRNRQAAIRGLDHARDVMAHGTHVWIAPEGTRSLTGELLPFKKGAFHLAFEAEMLILPVTLSGTRDTLPAKGWRSNPGANVRVTIHPEVDPRPYAAHGKTGQKALMTDVRAVIASAL